MSVLYIAGPMSGYPDKNEHLFLHAEERLRSLGYDVRNPLSVEGDGKSPWTWYMREGIKLLLESDAVAVLDDWECSMGARLEVQIAMSLQMQVKPVVRWPRVT